MAELRELGLRFESGEEDRPPEGPLTGQTYVITGTLEGWSRDAGPGRAGGTRCEGHELRLEEDHGLIVGEEPGASKLTKAQTSGVPLLDEAELADLLRG